MGRMQATVGLEIEEGRISMADEDECEVSVATLNRRMEGGGPVCTIYATQTCKDDVWAEIALDDIEQVRELRDLLSRTLEYRGEADA